MFLDVFGICDNNADEKKMFLILFGSEFKQVEFTQHCGEKFEENVYLLCMPPLPLQQHGTAETGEDQTMHVARARQLSWTDSLFPLCFLCGKGTEGIAVKPSCFLGFNLLYARRGVKPTQFDASARY